MITLENVPAHSPDWILVLRQACGKSSQRRVSSVIGYSPAVICLVLNGSYGGNLVAVEARVRDRLMKHALTCPVKGQITMNECLSNQAEPFSAASAAAVKLWLACQGCSRNGLGGK